VILGKARLVTDQAEKIEGLRCLTNHVVRGRWEEVRPPTEKELAATSVLVLPIHEASAKVRSGPPLDTEDDWSLPVWAGVVPVGLTAGEPVPDGHVLPTANAVEPARFKR
jgi:hypothetical protein